MSCKICKEESVVSKSSNEEMFSILADFIRSSDRSDIDEIMTLDETRGKITLHNYVGVVSLANGEAVEILPKLYGNGISDDKLRSLVREMLKTIYDLPFKYFRAGGTASDEMNIFEDFIRMYADEVISIAKYGLRGSYETIRSNERFFKGKMIFSEQLRYNFTLKDRCFIEFDEFNVNRPENRIIKSTLGVLLRKSSDPNNKSDLRHLLDLFSDVEFSKNYADDLAKIVPDRNTRDYKTALSMSRLFLNGSSATAYMGSDVTVSLLYPMEMLYERYIAELVKSSPKIGGFAFSAQVDDKYLFDKIDEKYVTKDRESNLTLTKFKLRPDIVLEKDGRTVIIDTKWKLLNSNKKNLGISEDDMYQMYAYGRRFSAESVTLLYPKTRNVNETVDYISAEMKIKVRFVDMSEAEKAKKSIDALLKELLGT